MRYSAHLVTGVMYLVSHSLLQSAFSWSTITVFSHENQKIVPRGLIGTLRYSSSSPVEENLDSGYRSTRFSESHAAIDSSALGDNNRTSSVSLSRAGGRSRTSSNTLKSFDNWFHNTKQLAPKIVSILMLLLFSRFVLSFLVAKPDSSPSFVYYQKTVYESSSYNAASGKVERARKESFRSNIPSLISGQSSGKEEGENGKHISSYIFEQNPDEAIDRELLELFPRTIFDDFF